MQITCKDCYYHNFVNQEYGQEWYSCSGPDVIGLHTGDWYCKDAKVERAGLKRPAWIEEELTRGKK